ALRVLLNNGVGGTWFQDAQPVGGGNVDWIDLLAADLNGDGLNDLIGISMAPTGPPVATASVFLNQTLANRGIPLTLLSGTGSGGNDFTNGQVAPIYGTIYDDANGNGVRDPGEAGRGGVTVYLDLAGNGTFDPNRDPWTTTDAAGTYAFAD